ncbi:MAG: glycosyltransferase [Paludibacteraceae bacterium]|nr:glycosyltransferase [Paludibacteraceae bacterium]
MEKIKYQVCIRCYTYNQSQYILDALNSFVNQKTNFPYVIVVVDDASTDGEPEIIRNFVDNQFSINDQTVAYSRDTEYANIIYAQHSNNKNCYIAAVLLKQNLYKEKDKKSEIVDEWRSQSKYEAICEGDDWWISDNKIQKQFDVLESHPEIDMCACGAIRMKEGKNIGSIQPSKEERILSVEETILGGGGFLATNSLMSRVTLYNDKYKFWKKIGLDFFYQIHGSLRGGIYYIPGCMVAYRVSATGSWSSSMKKNKGEHFFHIAKVQETLNLLNEETYFKYDDTIKRKLLKNYFQMFVLGFSNNLFREAFKETPFLGKIRIMYKITKNIF